VRTFFTVIKGARSAPSLGRTLIVEALRAEQLTAVQRRTVRLLVTATGGPCRAGRRLPILGPPGHVGVGALSPRADRTDIPQRSAVARQLHKVAHPSGARS
jgi:hypothetical protein